MRLCEEINWLYETGRLYKLFGSRERAFFAVGELLCWSKLSPKVRCLSFFNGIYEKYDRYRLAPSCIKLRKKLRLQSAKDAETLKNYIAAYKNKPVSKIDILKPVSPIFETSRPKFYTVNGMVVASPGSRYSKYREEWGE